MAVVLGWHLGTLRPWEGWAQAGLEAKVFLPDLAWAGLMMGTGDMWHGADEAVRLHVH